MNRTARLLPTLLALVVVALVSVAGSATAAKLITGKQVKNGSLTSVDVRNNNLTGADLKTGSIPGADLKDGTVSGADLADDSVGHDDLAVDAWVTAGLAGNPEIDVPNCPDQTLQICPALTDVEETGRIAITMSGTLENVGDSVPTPTRCGIQTKHFLASAVKFAPAAAGQPGSVIPFTLQATAIVNEPADRPVLRCTQFAGDDLRITGLKTMVITVHTLD